MVYVYKWSFYFYNTDWVTFDLHHVIFRTNKSQGKFPSYVAFIATYFTPHSHFIFLNKYERGCCIR